MSCRITGYVPIMGVSLIAQGSGQDLIEWSPAVLSVINGNLYCPSFEFLENAVIDTSHLPVLLKRTSGVCCSGTLLYSANS